MGVWTEYALLSAALLPLVAAMGCLFRSDARWVLAVAPFCAVPALVVALLPVGLEQVGVPWLFMGAQIGLDRTGRLFLLAAASVWLAAAIFAQSQGIGGQRAHRFFGCFYAAMAGNFLLIVAADAVTFLTGFALMSYAGYGLVVHRFDGEAIRAAKVYLILVVLAEVLLFAGAVLAWGIAGGWELSVLQDALSTAGPAATVAIAFLLCGFGIKAAMVPLHVWLPLAHPAAPVPASAVLSAAMIKAGLLGWIRFLPFGYQDLQWLGWWTFVAGIVAALAGVMIGVVQSRPKTILAYSSISQMGYMTILLALSALTPELYPAISVAVLVYVVHHAVAKGALFLSVSVVREAPRRWWSKLLEGIGLVVPALALAGAPLTTGAVAKAELKHIPDTGEGALPALFDPVLIVGAVATTVLMVRFLWVVWPRSRRREPISNIARLVWFALATAVVWAPWVIPWQYLRRATVATLEPAAIWSALWPLVVGVMLSIVFVRRHHLLSGRLEDSIPAGDLLLPVATLLQEGRATLRFGIRVAQSALDMAVGATRRRIAEYRRFLFILEIVEARLRRQAWDWVWIIVVGAGLLTALIL